MTSFAHDDSQTAAQTLERAAHLQQQGRRAARWYVRYLVAFAVASFVMAALFGVVGSFWGAAVITPLWVVFVCSLSVWAAHRRTFLKNFGRRHTAMILVWSAAWALTVIVGTRSFPGQVWWWALGGIAMAAAPLVLALRYRADG